MKLKRPFPRKKDRAKKRRLKAELKQLARKANAWQQKVLTALQGISNTFDKMDACFSRMEQRFDDQELSDKAENWAVRVQSTLPN